MLLVGCSGGGFLWKLLRMVVLALSVPAVTLTAGAETLLEEKFDGPLGPEWFWGLGTWTAQDGVLHGFESGKRRHCPVKMRKLLIKDAVLECDFRLMGKATFAGIIFNGSQDRGHIVHLVMGKDQIRVLAHPKKGENVELFKTSVKFTVGDWHHVKLTFSGDTLVALVDHHKVIAKHACIEEEKQTFGLGGDSGGPEGEKAGALEFRALKIVR